MHTFYEEDKMHHPGAGAFFTPQTLSWTDQIADSLPLAKELGTAKLEEARTVLRRASLRTATAMKKAVWICLGYALHYTGHEHRVVLRGCLLFSFVCQLSALPFYLHVWLLVSHSTSVRSRVLCPLAPSDSFLCSKEKCRHLGMKTYSCMQFSFFFASFILQNRLPGQGRRRP